MTDFVKPNISGMYRTYPYGDYEPYYQYWNGEFWGYYSDWYENAVANKNDKSRFQDVKWEEV